MLLISFDFEGTKFIFLKKRTIGKGRERNSASNNDDEKNHIYFELFGKLVIQK
jgi:hypothetical protein